LSKKNAILKITGIVLAGGKSSRIGTEKGLVSFRNKLLIEYSLNVVSLVADEIIISSNSAVYDGFGFPVLKDEFPDSGPMGGIYTCLKASKNDVNIVLSCDMPMVNADFLNALLAASEGFDVVVPWHEKKYFEPLCAVYRKNLLPVFKDFIQNKNFRIPDLFAVVNTNYLKIGKEFGVDPLIFFNINTLQQLDELTQMVDTDKENENEKTA
jgi:molybdopterin-guanine dinucleotide biosynthesis protein A